MITSVPLWEHAIVVLALFGSNALLFFTSKRKIEALQSALLAKRVLLRHPTHSVGGRQQIAPGEIYVVTDKAGSELVHIFAHSSCDISIRSFA